MQQAVIYTRVSTDEQAEKGYSLRHQKEVLQRYSELSNINILMHFEEDFSAKNFDRPEFIKLKEFCKANKKSIDLILFTRWDRFSRNAQEAYRVIDWFKKIGIQVNSFEQPLDMTIPDQKMLLAMYLIMPEIENDKNSIRTKEGMRRAQKEGYWTQHAPFGYDNFRNESDRSTLIPNKDAPLVVKAFEIYSKGLDTMEEVRRKIRKKGFKGNKQVFNRLLKRETYIGKIKISAWKDEEEKIVDGIHDPIISEELFYRVQDIIKKKRPHEFIRIKYNENLPLRGHLNCHVCGGVLTGSGSQGRGGKYYYYHCQRGCKTRFRADEAGEIFIKYLSSMNIKKEVAKLYKEIIKDVIKEKEGDISFKKTGLKKRIIMAKNQLENAQDKYFSGEIESDTFNNANERYTKIIGSLERDLNDFNVDEMLLDTQINFSFNLLKDLDFYYLNASARFKGNILGSIFPENLVYFNKNYRTQNSDSVISLIANIAKVSGGTKIQKVTNNGDQSLSAPREGLEPPT